MTPQPLDSLLTALAALPDVTDFDDRAALRRAADVVRCLSIRPEVVLVVGDGADLMANALHETEEAIRACRDRLQDVAWRVEELATAANQKGSEE